MSVPELCLILGVTIAFATLVVRVIEASRK
jgi:hypothetical protein